MNLLTKQKETHREWTYGEKDGRGVVVRVFGIDMYTLLYLKWIINKDVLYSAVGCGSLDGRGFGGEWVRVYGWASLLCSWNSHNLVNRLGACSVTQLCLTLCDPMDCSPPGFSVHGILLARISKWVAVSFSRGSSQPRTVEYGSLCRQMSHYRQILYCLSYWGISGNLLGCDHYGYF